MTKKEFLYFAPIGGMSISYIGMWITTISCAHVLWWIFFAFNIAFDIWAVYNIINVKKFM